MVYLPEKLTHLEHHLMSQIAAAEHAYVSTKTCT